MVLIYSFFKIEILIQFFPL